jgi:hypothetical protein
MSGRLHWSSNGKQDVELCDTLQRACVEQLDGNSGYLHQESNQLNEHEQSIKPSESDSFTHDAGSSATATRATPITRSTVGHTSFPCAHCNDYDPRVNTSADYIERDYADYIAATGSSGENTRSGVRNSDEPRNFKQADAESSDSVERRIGIPAGVTI